MAIGMAIAVCKGKSVEDDLTLWSKGSICRDGICQSEHLIVVTMQQPKEQQIHRRVETLRQEKTSRNVHCDKLQAQVRADDRKPARRGTIRTWIHEVT